MFQADTLFDVPGCSGMFHVPVFINGPTKTACVNKGDATMLKISIKTCCRVISAGQKVTFVKKIYILCVSKQTVTFVINGNLVADESERLS